MPVLGRDKADAERDRRRHHHDQLRHGQPERGDGDGPARRPIAPKAALFLGKCGGLKKKNKLGDLILPIAAIRGEGTSNDYLLPEVPALPAFQSAARRVDDDPRPRPRLLDRHRLHDQPPRLGTRRRIQGIPAQDALHGDRHGNRDDLRRRLRQPHSVGRAVAGVRSADDPRRREDRSSAIARSPRTSSRRISRSASRR